MPQGPGTYGKKVGRPPKKKYHKGGKANKERHIASIAAEKTLDKTSIFNPLIPFKFVKNVMKEREASRRKKVSDEVKKTTKRASRQLKHRAEHERIRSERETTAVNKREVTKADEKVRPTSNINVSAAATSDVDNTNIQTTTISDLQSNLQQEMPITDARDRSISTLAEKAESAVDLKTEIKQAEKNPEVQKWEPGPVDPTTTARDTGPAEFNLHPYLQKSKKDLLNVNERTRDDYLQNLEDITFDEKKAVNPSIMEKLLQEDSEIYDRETKKIIPRQNSVTRAYKEGGQVQTYNAKNRSSKTNI